MATFVVIMTWLNVQRSVGAIQDGRRWIFEQQGEPLPCEETEAYFDRIIRKRFTHSMLVDVRADFWLSPFEEEFYLRDGVFVTSNWWAGASRRLTA
ncbi:MAG: hypothetical protein QM662_04975 [Gordonia sp. (in: high G+C Gram-positive bacteria)]